MALPACRDGHQFFAGEKLLSEWFFDGHQKGRAMCLTVN